jgi:hypothetical protein
MTQKHSARYYHSFSSGREPEEKPPFKRREKVKNVII